MPGYRWKAIADLPAAPAVLARVDLDDALDAWLTEKRTLRDPRRVEEIEARLARNWAIETGIIERLYTIDRGTTEMLIDLGLGALEQFSTTGQVRRDAARLIADQAEALDFIFDYVKDERSLTASYLKELHQLFCRNQEYVDAATEAGERVRTPLIRGDWKRWPNNPQRPDGSIHEYCPPEFVQDEIDRLLAWHATHLAEGVRPEVEAAWLHHRFTQIHPFMDGNGRVARALATMVFLRFGFLPLVIRDSEHRERYLDALETADRGDLSALIDLFANIQESDLHDAITSVREIRAGAIGTVAKAAAEAAQRTHQHQSAAVGSQTAALLKLSHHRLQEVAEELQDEFRRVGLELRAHAQANDDQGSAFWSRQIVAAGRKYGYYPDLTRPRWWVRLRLTVLTEAPSVSYLVVSFHHKEQRTALMSAVVFLTAGEADLYEARPVEFGSDREFTYSGASLDEDRFRSWLEDALSTILGKWQARL